MSLYVITDIPCIYLGKIKETFFFSYLSPDKGDTQQIAIEEWVQNYKLQSSSVTQSCPTLCDPMDCSMPDLPVHHQLLEHIQTHVHHVNDAIQPRQPLLSSSTPVFNLSHYQGFFSSELILHIRWLKYWSFSFIISPPSE